MKKKPVFVPASAIADKPVNFVEEMFQSLDVPRSIGGVFLPPPVLGCYALLELIDSDYFRHPESCSLQELGRALVVFRQQKRAKEKVSDFVFFDDKTLDFEAEGLLLDHGDELVKVLPELAEYLLVTPFLGFEMLPGGSPPEGAFYFESPVLANACYAMAEAANLTPEQVFWEVPCCLVGHLAAQAAKANGKEGVSRPKDPEDIRRQLKLARERADRGERQPWEK